MHMCLVSKVVARTLLDWYDQKHTGLVPVHTASFPGT